MVRRWRLIGYFPILYNPHLAPLIAFYVVAVHVVEVLRLGRARVASEHIHAALVRIHLDVGFQKGA
jgi:hypothetical protein